MPDWDNQKALTIFEQMLQQTPNQVDGVLAANDGLGNAVISANKQRKLKQIPVTGQDATPQGIQHIVTGDQCMTVYKAIKKEADADAALAITLAKGDTPSGETATANNENRDVPSVLLKPVAVTKGNIKEYLGDQDFLTQTEICAGKLAALCKPAGFHDRVHRRRGAARAAPLRGAAPGAQGSPQALRRRAGTARRGLPLREGEVMALVGDNGAGKSVTLKCIAGIYPIDTGELLWEGKPSRSPGRRTRRRSASRSSTRTSRSPTTSTSCRTCTSAARRSRSSARSTSRRWSAAAARRQVLSVTTIRSVRQTVAGLSGGQRQSIAVAKAVMWNSRLVILDEPTAALGVAQTRQVLDLVKRLAEQGLAVMLISHNLSDIFEVADRITVLRLGQDVADSPPARRRSARSSRRSPRASSALFPVRTRRRHESAPLPDRRPRRAGRQVLAMSAITPPCRRRAGRVDRDDRQLRQVLGRQPARRGAWHPADHPRDARHRVVFQVENGRFLTAGNFVNLIVQGAGSRSSRWASSSSCCSARSTSRSATSAASPAWSRRCC